MVSRNIWLFNLNFYIWIKQILKRRLSCLIFWDRIQVSYEKPLFSAQSVWRILINAVSCLSHGPFSFCLAVCIRFPFQNVIRPFDHYTSMEGSFFIPSGKSKPISLAPHFMGPKDGPGLCSLSVGLLIGYQGFNKDHHFSFHSYNELDAANILFWRLLDVLLKKTKSASPSIGDFINAYVHLTSYLHTFGFLYSKEQEIQMPLEEFLLSLSGLYLASPLGVWTQFCCCSSCNSSYLTCLGLWWMTSRPK